MVDLAESACLFVMLIATLFLADWALGREIESAIRRLRGAK